MTTGDTKYCDYTIGSSRHIVMKFVMGFRTFSVTTLTTFYNILIINVYDVGV